MAVAFTPINLPGSYFVWPDPTTVVQSTPAYSDGDIFDTIWVSDRSPSGVSTNCTCAENYDQSYYAYSNAITFGLWNSYSANGTSVGFDIFNIESQCKYDFGRLCFFTLHESDGKGMFGWGTPLAQTGLLNMYYTGTKEDRHSPNGQVPIPFQLTITAPFPTTPPDIRPFPQIIAASPTTTVVLGTPAIHTSSSRATNTPVAGAISETVAETSSKGSASTDVLSTSTFLGIAAGGVAVLCIILALLLYCYRWRNRKPGVARVEMIVPRRGPFDLMDEKDVSNIAKGYHIDERMWRRTSRAPSLAMPGYISE